MAGNIFVSYRREDSKHAAGRLVDRLSRNFAPGQLFLDVDNVEPGLDFKKVLTDKVQQCDVLLAVIGPGWLDTRDATGARRLDNPKDFVRIEIEAALARDVRVIPVLVDGALMPSEEELPETLQPFTYRNAVRLSHERFAADAEDLAKAVARAVRAVEDKAASANEVTIEASAASRKDVPNPAPGKWEARAWPLAVAIAYSVAASALTWSSIGWFEHDFNLDFSGVRLGFAISLVAACALAWTRGSQLTGAEIFFYWIGCAVSGVLLLWLDVSVLTAGAVIGINALIVALLLAALSGIALAVWWNRRTGG
jgi:hypothetical protein